MIGGVVSTISVSVSVVLLLFALFVIKYQNILELVLAVSGSVIDRVLVLVTLPVMKRVSPLMMVIISHDDQVPVMVGFALPL